MTGRDAAVLLGLLLAAALSGCASTAVLRKPVAPAPSPISSKAGRPALQAGKADTPEPVVAQAEERLPGNARVELVSLQIEDADAPAEEPDGPAIALPDAVDDESAVETPEYLPPPVPVPPETLTLDDVLKSVRATYPLLAVELEARRVAAGEHLNAWGSFDTQLAGSAITQPTGDYENHRFALGVEQPTLWGARVFGGYRIGRGTFEPWYKERETDEGGEFRAGIAVPLAQNLAIDPRRAEVWRTSYARTRVEFDIQRELIAFTQAAAYAYWDWVAAGENRRISRALLELAQERVEYLRGQIEEQQLPPIALVDNQRLIVSREARLIEAQQALQVSAINLSLFLRDPQANPIVPPPDWLPESLPQPEPFDPVQVEADIAVALANRPELRQLTVLRQQLEVDLALARNQLQPTVDGTLTVSQDVGQDAMPEPKGAFGPNDKDEFILEAGLLVEVPLQRRQARGRILAAQGKLAQNAARRTFAHNRVVADVQTADASLAAAYEQYQRATESVELNRRLEEAERDRLRELRSDLLLVNLREQATADAALARVAAWRAYFRAQANRRAALALDAAGEPGRVHAPEEAPPSVGPHILPSPTE